MSDITYFWDIALKMETAPGSDRDVPANNFVANVLVRNTPLQFDEDFIKTGGGEDIDFCLRLPKWPLQSVPKASATHPW